MSAALAALNRLGVRVRLGPGGQVQIAPKERITDEVRDLARRNLSEIRAALSRYRVWQVTLADGTRLTAIRPTGATMIEVLEHERAVFGDERVLDVQPIALSEIRA